MRYAVLKSLLRPTILACALWACVLGRAYAQDDGNVCGGASSNAQAISELITELSRLEVLDEKAYGAKSVYPLLVALNDRVRSQADIEAFRCRDDLQIVLKLISFAKSDERALRVNASLLLANVVDNTTLCGVLNELLTHGANDSAQYNFWQIVLVVTGYARVENKKWIAATIKDSRESLTDAAAYAKTLRLIEQVEAALARNDRDATMISIFPAEYEACIALPKIAALETPPAPAPPAPQ